MTFELKLSPVGLYRRALMPWIGKRGRANDDENQVSLSAMVACVDNAATTFEHFRCSLENKLFSAIADTLDQDERKQYLKLKRKVALSKATTRPALPSANLCDSLVIEVQEYLAAWTQLDEKISLLRQELHGRQQEEEERIADALTNEDFRTGLRFASKPMYDEAVVLHGALTEMSAQRRKKARWGIQKYLDRATYRTTPFGRFTRVGVLLMSIEEPEPFNKQEHLVQFTRQANKGLFPLLWALLLEDLAGVRRLPVASAIISKRDGERIKLLTVRNQKERIELLPATEALTHLLDWVGQGGRTIGDVLDYASQAIEATDSQETQDYVKKLIDRGLLIPYSAAGFSDSLWTTELLRELSTSDSPNAIEVREFVRMLDNASGIGDFGTASETDELLNRLEAKLAELQNALKPDRKVSTKAILTEDTCGQAYQCRPMNSPVFRTLERYVNAVAPFGWPSEENRVLRELLEREFDGNDTPLVAFFEAYARNIGVPQETKRTAGTIVDPDCYGLGENIARRRQYSRVAFDVRQRAAVATDCSEIDIPIAHIESLLGIGPSNESLPVSVSVFCTPFSTGNEKAPVGLVIPAGRTYLGLGKYTSRFWWGLPQLMEQAREMLNSCDADLEFCEIRCDMNFNANLHPRATKRVIAYPNMPQADTSPLTLHVDQLSVVRAADQSNGAWLRDNTSGKRIVPLDLGFQNLSMRPQLHQVLLKFQPPCASALDLEAAARTMRTVEVFKASQFPREKATYSYEFTPRLTIEGSLVVSRARWGLSIPLTLELIAQEDNAVSFCVLQQLRRATGLPDRVFARLVRAPSSGGQVDSNKFQNNGARKLRDDLFKPRFIDLTSRLGFSLLGEYLSAGSQFTFVLEEALPDPKTEYQLAERLFAEEFVLQFDRRAGQA